MIDRKHIGRVLPKAVLDIEKGRLLSFAKAIGEINPIYTDEAAASAGITHLGNILTCTGKVVEKYEKDGSKLVRIDIQAANQYGDPKTVGEVLVALA